MIEPTFPGAEAPERTTDLDSGGVRLRLLEWGDPSAKPAVLCHGMWDHARGFAVLGPLLARRFRVVAIDARGHGGSGWASAYSWPMDVRDIVNVLRWLGRPAHLIGHSKGGGQVTDAARVAAELVTKLVNMDGFGPPPFTPAQQPTPARCAAFLDERRGASDRQAWRPYASLEDLIQRRGSQNPRLSGEWLRYFVFHAARQDDDAWRWKADPYMGHGFGPWRPEWIGQGYATLAVPMLAIVGSEEDTWGLPESILAERLSQVRNLERATIEGAGHFVHMEYPAECAEIILAYLES